MMWKPSSALSRHCRHMKIEGYRRYQFLLDVIPPLFELRKLPGVVHACDIWYFIWFSLWWADCILYQMPVNWNTVIVLYEFRLLLIVFVLCHFIAEGCSKRVIACANFPEYTHIWWDFVSGVTFSFYFTVWQWKVVRIYFLLEHFKVEYLSFLVFESWT